MRNQIGVCIIGVGRAGMIHAANFKSRVPYARITAIVDPVREIGEKACEAIQINK